jgi:hypothetical protein
LQHVTDEDKEVYYIFFCDILSRLEDDYTFAAKNAFSDKATFYLAANINRRNLKI